MGVFTTQLKHNHGHLFETHVIRISLVDPFHSISALLHLFTRQSCRGAVGHGLMVHEHCVSPVTRSVRQPADAARRREGGVTRGREGRATIGDSKTSWHDKRTRGGQDEMTRGLWDGRQCNNQPAPNQKEDDKER